MWAIQECRHVLGMAAHRLETLSRHLLLKYTLSLFLVFQVTPGLSVPPKISLSTHELNQPPPPIKPKPVYRRRSSGENPGRVMSSVTISPAKSFHLNMTDKPSNGDTPNPAVTLRRGSVDRTAMENRSFVITSENVDYNSNLKSRSSSALESSSGNTRRMDGSYFMWL